MQQSYFPDGATKSLQAFTGTGTTTPLSHAFGFSLEGEGRPYGFWDSTAGNQIVGGITTYNVAGQPTQVTILGGQENFQYDPNSGRMTRWQSVVAKTQTGNLTWNANGTLQTMAITDTSNAGNNQTCTNGYDDLERITSTSCGTGGSIWHQTFSYDYFGNISKSGNSAFLPGSYTGNRANSILTYDTMGNVTYDGTNNYTYDAEGRPLTVGGTSLQITYDAFNRPVFQNRGGSYTSIVYGPTGQKFGLMNGSAIKQYFVPLAAGMQAVFNSSGVQYYRHSDWLGNSRLASNASDGSVYYDSAYAPFGENYAESGTTDRSFTGQTQDTVSGLYDFLYRQHSSAQGRWLVPDPAGLAAADLTNPQTWNRYGNVGNQPLRSVDPLGQSVKACGWDIYCGYGAGGGAGNGGGGGGGYYGGDTISPGVVFSGPLWDLEAEAEARYDAQVALSDAQFNFRTTDRVASCSNTASDLQVSAFPYASTIQITSMTGTTTMRPNVDQDGQQYSSSWSPVLVGGMSPTNSAGLRPGPNFLYQNVLFQSPNNSPYPFTFNLDINVSISGFNSYGNPSTTNVTVPETVKGLVFCGDAQRTP